MSVAVAASLVFCVALVAVMRKRAPAVASASPSVQSAQPGDGGRAEAAVRLTFDAIAKRDCDSFVSLTTGEIAAHTKARTCKGLLDSYEEHKFGLVRTEGSEPDGRAPSTARMVKIRIKFEKGERAGLARVEKVGDTWKVAAF